MKKILIFHHYNSSLGAGLSLLHILKSIDRSKYDIILCIPKIKGDLDEKAKDLGITVKYIEKIPPYMHFSGNHTLFFSLKHFKNCVEILKQKKYIEKTITKLNPDFIIINSMTLFWIGKIAKKLNKKIICFHRESYRRGMFGIRTSIIKKHLSEDFDVVVFLSDYDLKHTPERNAKYFIITDKVDVDLYTHLDCVRCRKENNLPLNDKLILYVGGLAKLKGPEVVIHAMNKIDDKNVKLVFLQYQDQVSKNLKLKIKYYLKIIFRKNINFKIKYYINKEHLENRIIFRPPTDHVEKYFCASDIVVFPSVDAHQARPAFEAGISRKPFIITDFDNTREFINETNGWVFKKNNSLDLAKKIEEILQNKNNEVKTKVEENYGRVLKNNNISTLSKELSNVFNYLEER